MKRIYPLLVGSFVLALAVTVLAQRRGNERTFVPQGQEDLAAKVERLEEQVARLQAQVQDLRGRRTIITTPPVPAVPGNPLPKGWKEGEFNGLKYYIVPCEQTIAVPTTQPVK